MPAFDYKSAKADGVSDADIAAYIDAQRAKGVDLYINRVDYTSPASGPKFTAAPAEGTVVPQFDTPQSRAAYRETMGALPQAGGMIGGALGGPPGAAAGGFLGELGRQGMTGDPFDAGVAARQGVVQGALEGAGRMIAAGAGAVANPIMKSVLGGGNSEISDLVLHNSPKDLARMANETDALADVQTAFGMPGADATRATADNLLAARDAASAASTKWLGKLNPLQKWLLSTEGHGAIASAIWHPQTLAPAVGSAAATVASTSPALRYYLARGLASPGLQAAIAQSPRALAGWLSAPVDATR